jgi:hypothetical protein
LAARDKPGTSWRVGGQAHDTARSSCVPLLSICPTQGRRFPEHESRVAYQRVQNPEPVDPASAGLISWHFQVPRETGGDCLLGCLGEAIREDLATPLPPCWGVGSGADFAGREAEITHQAAMLFPTLRIGHLGHDARSKRRVLIHGFLELLKISDRNNGPRKMEYCNVVKPYEITEDCPNQATPNGN